MSQRRLPAVQDGDQGPTYRFPILDGPAVRNLASAAVEVYVEDTNGLSLGVLPGVITQAKSTGQVDIRLKGGEADLGGAGGEIVLIPKFYYATAPDGTPATNVLTNPSFDTDTTPADGVADGWSLGAGQPGTGTYGLRGNFGDAWPTAIFGNSQLVLPDTSLSSQYMYQTYTPGGTIALGEQWSSGIWYRGAGITGSSSDGHGLYAELHTPGDQFVVTRFPIASSDWRFYIATIIASQSGNTIARCKVHFNNSNLGTRRFDEAFLFKGYWRAFCGERLILPVSPRSVPAKNTNQLAGIGSFEQDSDADGVPDGFRRMGTAATISLDSDPANVSEGKKALKVVLGAATAGDWMRCWHRGKFKSGEVWRIEVKYKNSGAVAGSPPGGQWGLIFETENFGKGTLQSATGTLSQSSTPNYVTVSADCTLTADADCVLLELRWGSVSGATLWFDDMKLYRVSP